VDQASVSRSLPRCSSPLLRGALLAVLLTPILTLAAGATEVTFQYRPSGPANTVCVAGSFNEWNLAAHPMAGPDADGLWKTRVDIPAGTHQYKFVVNGDQWFTDETAAAFADDGFGGQNSVLELGSEPVTVGRAEGPALSAEIEPSGTEVTFRYPAPSGPFNSLSVAGSFNGWDAAANPLSDIDGDGFWEVTARLEPGSHAYQFVVDGDRWIADGRATAYEDDGFGGRNALLTVGAEPLVIGDRGDLPPR